MEQYAANFINHGYDLPTAIRANSSDLAAIRLLNPTHRTIILDKGAMMKHNPSTRLPFTQQQPETVSELLKGLALDQYIEVLAQNQIDAVEKLTHVTAEDLQVGFECVCYSKLLEKARFVSVLAGLQIAIFFCSKLRIGIPDFGVFFFRKWE